MDTRLLRHFTAVYEERNITRAAKRCFISQPALSSSIAQLEEQLGIQAFERSKKGVQPTAQAETLYPTAIRILRELDELPAQFSEESPIRELTLAIMADISHYQSAAFIRHIRPLLEPLRLTLVHESLQADARLVLDMMKREDEYFLPLWREEYLLCMAADHPLAAKDLITHADLDGEPLIECPPCHAHRLTIDTLADSKMDAALMASSDSKQQLISLLLAGYGVTFLPEGMIKAWPELVIRPYEGTTMYRTVGLASSATERPDANVQRLLEHFRGHNPEQSAAKFFQDDRL